MRTFFWHDRVVSASTMLRYRVLRRDTSRYFTVGNAGDILNADLIQWAYSRPAVNVRNDGRRLLLVGSVAHLMRDGDYVCGIGTKGEQVPTAAEASCTILSVRGPLTAEVLRRAGHDLSNVRSMLDPGLLVRHMLPDAPAVKGRTVLVPHYRERNQYKRHHLRGLRVVDIDGHALDVARQIQQAEMVYTSSLHGLIFAHALRRPCVLIAPLTVEPEFKYRDYCASVGLPWRTPPTLDEARRAPSPTSPLDLSYSPEDFPFPSLAELQAAGVAD